MAEARSKMTLGGCCSGANEVCSISKPLCLQICLRISWHLLLSLNLKTRRNTQSLVKVPGGTLAITHPICVSTCELTPRQEKLCTEGEDSSKITSKPSDKHNLHRRSYKWNLLSVKVWLKFKRFSKYFTTKCKYRATFSYIK